MPVIWAYCNVVRNVKMLNQLQLSDGYIVKINDLYCPLMIKRYLVTPYPPKKVTPILYN